MELAGRNRWIALIVVCIGDLMIVLDATKPVRSITAAGTDRPKKDRYTAAISANHVKTSEAGSSTTVPSTVAVTSVLTAGCTLPATAQA